MGFSASGGPGKRWMGGGGGGGGGMGGGGWACGGLKERSASKDHCFFPVQECG